MDQDVLNQEVRERLKKFIEEKGVRIAHISKKTNLPDYLIRKFKNDKKKSLWPDSLKRLSSFLEGENY